MLSLFANRIPASTIGRLALRLHRNSGVSAPASTELDKERVARAFVPRGADRRRHSRSGRRTEDPHVSEWHWRRVAFLFAAYVAYVSLRTLPSTVQRWFKRSSRV
jgi:hypothetical protein